MKYCTIILVAACIAVFAMQNIANITDDFVLVSSDVIRTSVDAGNSDIPSC